MKCNLDRIFAALADPTRRRILQLLLERDMTVTEIAAKFEISLAGISKHLQILLKSKLMTRRKEGRNYWCQIELEGLQPAAIWLQEFGYVDEQLLNTLESLIDQEKILKMNR